MASSISCDSRFLRFFFDDVGQLTFGDHALPLAIIIRREKGIRALSDIIAQCLNLEREFDHDASKLCIFGFEALK